MIDEISLLRETSPTFVALEGFLPSVSSFVVKKVRLLFERFVAILKNCIVAYYKGKVFGEEGSSSA